jgi:3-deoxy-D-manno-octulosonate 8-phosphate phosphatase (KDO 8-P phosphatase)
MIDHIVFDIDGTLTDGGITFTDNGAESKQFQAKDGIVMRVLPKLGYTTMFITGRDSKLTIARAEDLKISKVFQGVDDKEGLLKKYMAENSLTGQQYAYIGDDSKDYAAMKL